MSSIQLRALNRQGSSSAASGANASHGETSSAAAAGSASSITPGYSPGPSLQQQQRLSLERARLRTQTTTTSPGHTTVVQQSSTPPQAAPQQASQTPNSNTQRNSDGRLRTLWKKIVKERGFEVAVVGIILALIVMAPTFGSYATGVWSSAKDYQDWCKSEKSANHTLTRVCSLIVNRPLPPPPGLDQVFKDIGRPEPIPVTPPKVWKRATEEELEMAHAFIRGPVGNGLSLMFFGFFLLMMPLEDKDLKWGQFLFVYFVFMITRKATIIFVLRNVSLMMDWALWLRRVGAKGPSWSSLMVLPVLYAVGYMNEKSFASQMTISIISGLVVGDEYSHKLIFVYQFMMGFGYGE